MDRIDEMKLALHRWIGAGFKDIKPERLLTDEVKAAFDVLLRAQNDKHQKYIVITQDEFTKITAEQSGGKAEYNKEYHINGYSGVIEGGLDGYIILRVM
jgi:hypothetical protein